VRYALSEFKLGVEIFKEVVNNIENKNIILQQWIEIIKPYNFIYKDWLKYTYSSMLGIFISRLDFNIIELKVFFRELMKYESVISAHTVYYTILKNDPLLFKSLANKQILERLMTDNITEALNHENSSEIFFQYAAMYSYFDQGISYRLLIDGINNEILRPAYRGDQLISMILPGCLYFAYQNYWYNEFELDDMFSQLWKIICRLEKTTDNSNSYGCFKSAVRICLSRNKIFDNLYDVDECNIYQKKLDITENINNSTQIDEESLSNYYSCKIEGLPYDSLEFWQKLIQENYRTDEKLIKLYQAFDDNYPSMYGYPIIDYIYIPVAVLLSKAETKDQIINYVMEHGGEYGFYNIIRAYSLTSDTYEAKRCIEFLISFSKMLVESNGAFAKIVNSKEGTSSHSLDLICKSKHEDWNFFEDKCMCVLKSNHKVKIGWGNYDERREFHEEWAISHPDKNAYLYDYCIYNGDDELKHLSLISIDGHRAILPIPRINTNIVCREDYLLSRLFNVRIETLNDYMRRSKLVVE